MKLAAIFAIILTNLYSTTFDYDNCSFSFESLVELKKVKYDQSDFDSLTIYEYLFDEGTRDISVSFRIIDFSKRRKINKPNVNEETTLKMTNYYINNIKKAGALENLELPIKTIDNWVTCSAVLKPSNVGSFYNVFYAKRHDNFIIAISIGSTKTNIEELKLVGRNICSSLKIDRYK